MIHLIHSYHLSVSFFFFDKQHKHSLSHNFFSFMDPIDTNPSFPTSQSIGSLDGSSPSSFPTSASTPSSLTSPSPLFLSPSSSPSESLLVQLLAQPFSTQGIALFALLEFCLGASLWVDGQAGGSLSVTGLGYLVVFDSLGVMGIVASEVLNGIGSPLSSLRSPFGCGFFWCFLWVSNERAEGLHQTNRLVYGLVVNHQETIGWSLSFSLFKLSFSFSRRCTSVKNPSNTSCYLVMTMGTTSLSGYSTLLSNLSMTLLIKAGLLPGWFCPTHSCFSPLAERFSPPSSFRTTANW